MEKGITIAAIFGVAPWIFLLVAVVADIHLKWVLVVACICIPSAIMIGRASARRQRNRSRH